MNPCAGFSRDRAKIRFAGYLALRDYFSSNNSWRRCLIPRSRECGPAANSMPSSPGPAGRGRFVRGAGVELRQDAGVDRVRLDFGSARRGGIFVSEPPIM